MQVIVSSIVKECVFPNMKTLPIGWENANDEQRSSHGMFMGLIEPPNGRSMEEYWEETVRDAVNYKYRQLKHQALNKLKKKVCGE